MSTITLPAPASNAKRKQPTRTMKIEGDPFNNGKISITVGKETTEYVTDMFSVAPDFGPFGFRFQKTETLEIYHLTCSSPDPTKAVIKCDCKGHTRHGLCKHADSLKWMLLNLDA